MLAWLKAIGLEQLGRQQVDGVVCQSEECAEYYAESNIPTACKQRIPTHEGGCAFIIFEYNSKTLISGGQDKTVKRWDTNTGSVSRTLYCSLGSVFDPCITQENKSVIAASSTYNLYLWDVNSGRAQHTLTGHMEKVFAVDVSRSIVSGAYNRPIKVWDLQKGYCVNNLMDKVFAVDVSNATSFSIDGQTFCSGHVDGNLRLWDIQNGNHPREVAAHSLAVTSISSSRNGNVIVTCGRDCWKYNLKFIA